MTVKRKAPGNAWKPGQSGNPAGKPSGARNRATQMVMALMEGAAEEITTTIIDAAKKGDLAAAKLVLERLAPPVRERAIALALPNTDTPSGINEAQRKIVEAVGSGDLLPAEGTALAGIVEVRRKAYETNEMDQRISELERLQAKK